MTRSVLGALATVSKPRIVGLLTLTGLSALLAAGGTDTATVVSFVVAGAGIAAASAAANCYYDRDLDRRMTRTRDRPLPSGDLSPRTVLAYAVACFGLGSAVGLSALPTAAVGYMWLGAASYVGLYTIALKRRHWLGVVLGGSAGSFPVLAGWRVAGDLTTAPVVMALLVFAWTPAHAWALAVVYRDDFGAAGIPTLPVVASDARTRRAVGVSLATTVGVAVALVSVAPAPYGSVAPVITMLLVAGYLPFLRGKGEPAAVRAFFTSNAALAALFVAWALSGVVGDWSLGGRLAALVALAGLVVATWLAQPSLRGVSAGPCPLLGWGRSVLGGSTDQEVPTPRDEDVRESAHRRADRTPN